MAIDATDSVFKKKEKLIHFYIELTKFAMLYVCMIEITQCSLNNIRLPKL